MRALSLGLLLATSALSIHAASEHPPANPEHKATDQPQKVASTAQGPSKGASAAIPIVIPPVQEKPTKPEQTEGDEHATEYWPLIFGVRFKIGESLLVLFTFLLWLATRALVVDAKKSSAKDLRAYISVDVETVMGENGVPAPNKVGLQMINCGKTPANALSQWSGIGVHNYPDPGLLPDPDLEIVVRAVLNPGRHRWIIHDLPTLSEAQRKEITAEKLALYVWGRISFEDVFKKKQTVDFAFVISGKHWSGGRWAAHGSHNKAT